METNPTSAVLLSALHRRLLSAVLILVCYEKIAIGMLTISPMVVAPVCRVGDSLQITCTASVQFIRWNTLQANEQGTLVEAANSVQINNVDANQMSQRLVDSAIFTYLRTSAQGTSPLISTLSIDSVNIGLNGTVVLCAGVGNPMISASTTIQIINISQNIQYKPTLSISEVHYGADNVTVTVNWSQTEPAQQVHVLYSSTVVPSDVSVITTGSTSRQLTIPYNTEYNLSVEAIVPCRPNATASIKLNYVNCGHPELLSMCRISNHYIPKVVGYDNLLIEGSTITFSCPPGSMLIGPNSATCTDSGEWEPDPSGLMCNESGMVPVEESRCTCSGVLAAAVSSTVVISLVISIITFITGFMFGNHLRIKFQFLKGKPHNIHVADQPHQAPEYEDIDAQPTVKAVKHQDEGLELKENVAYCPSKSIIKQ